MTFAPHDKLKLVIWDLDETFWRGTLTEGGITPVPRNAEIVRELAQRGILSSICSKNDHAAATRVLTDLGVWDYFVFPRIAWSGKGPVVRDLLDDMGLRAVNCLFIDDNDANRREVAFFCAGIKTAHPDEILDELLALPAAAGKYDAALTRLAQYRLLERKQAHRLSHAGGNEAFLRACNIRISIDHDVEPHLERVLELIERTNQLNYTKRRLASAAAVAAFRRKLNEFGVHAGVVSARDDYGDYGLVGFYLLHRSYRGERLEHFVFSCRTMNMGLEQFVYERLGRPQIAIAEPVAYGLDRHAAIDWITLRDAAGDDSGPAAGGASLFLLGACDLLQLSAFCKAGQRHEYVNYVDKGLMIRSDCPGLLLSEAQAVERSAILPLLPTWQAPTYRQLHRDLAAADRLIVSLPGLLRGHYVRTADGLLLRLIIPNFQQLRSEQPHLFGTALEEVKFTTPERLGLLGACLEAIRADSRPDATIFLLLQQELTDCGAHEKTLRAQYNERCRTFAHSHANVIAVDVNALLAADDIAEGDHFTRRGYMKIADVVNRTDGLQAGGDTAA